MSNYYPGQFPTFWSNLHQLIIDDQIFSVAQVYEELQMQLSKSHMLEWVDENKRIFRTPITSESLFIAEMFKVPKFRETLKEKQRITSRAFADPFIIAAGKLFDACIVTEESDKPNSSKIPTICKHFKIPCTDMEGFLCQNGWEW